MVTPNGGRGWGFGLQSPEAQSPEFKLLFFNKLCEIRGIGGLNPIKLGKRLEPRGEREADTERRRKEGLPNPPIPRASANRMDALS